MLTRRQLMASCVLASSARFAQAQSCAAAQRETREIRHVRQIEDGQETLTANVEVARLDLGEGVGLELAYIAAGSFEMGSAKAPSAQPVHTVEVPAFWCGLHEVTREQWRRVALLPEIAVRLGDPPGRWEDEARDKRLPVDLVYHRGAVEFCERLARWSSLPFRLPSEAEWEYACRAGSTTDYHYGDRFDPALSELERRGIPDAYGAPVMSAGFPNRYGLWHMHGNAAEWCADRYHENYDRAPVDGSAQQEPDPRLRWQSRVMRGGAASNRAQTGTSWSRSDWPEDITATGFGFRIVASRLECQGDGTAGATP